MSSKPMGTAQSKACVCQSQALCELVEFLENEKAVPDLRDLVLRQREDAALWAEAYGADGKGNAGFF